MGRQNPGVPVFFGGHNLPTLVEIGLTDLTRSGGAWHPWHPLVLCQPMLFTKNLPNIENIFDT